MLNYKENNIKNKSTPLKTKELTNSINNGLNKNMIIPVQQDISAEEMVLLVQKGNLDLHEFLLHTYQPFIAKCVAEVCKRYIDKFDDEFSIGLSGFNEAIFHFCPQKSCSFFTFAKLVVKRKVIDYLRTIQKLPIAGSLDEGCAEEKFDNPSEVSASTNLYLQKQEAWYRREEIKEYNQELKTYKLSLLELAEIAPKHVDARKSAIRVAKIIYEHEILRNYVVTKKKLPLKQLLDIVSVSKKTLERNRKYIIAIFIVLNGDYLYLNDYLKEVD